MLIRWLSFIEGQQTKLNLRYECSSFKICCCINAETSHVFHFLINTKERFTFKINIYCLTCIQFWNLDIIFTFIVEKPKRLGSNLIRMFTNIKLFCIHTKCKELYFLKIIYHQEICKCTHRSIKCAASYY